MTDVHQITDPTRPGAVEDRPDEVPAEPDVAPAATKSIKRRRLGWPARISSSRPVSESHRRIIES